MKPGGRVSTNRFDHLTLVVADAERSLEGLFHSLESGSDGMMQGALHCRDLSGALSILGLESAGNGGILYCVCVQVPFYMLTMRVSQNTTMSPHLRTMPHYSCE